MKTIFVFVRDEFVKNCCSKGPDRTVERCVKSLLTRCSSIADVFFEYFATSNSMPLRRSTDRLRSQIAPELMPFLRYLFGHLFLVSRLFQIGKVLCCIMIPVQIFANTSELQRIVCVISTKLFRGRHEPLQGILRLAGALIPSWTASGPIRKESLHHYGIPMLQSSCTDFARNFKVLLHIFGRIHDISAHLMSVRARELPCAQSLRPP